MLLALKVILSLILAYLIGSIPTAYIFGKVFKKIDIRKYGSGNVGATNAMRVLGKGPGIAVLILDALKGVIATTLVADLFGLNQVIWFVLLGLAAVVGHNWTVFLQFKGGKGIATTLGVLIGLMIKIEGMRLVVVLSISVWAVVFIAFGFVSLASMLAAFLLPIFTVIVNQPVEVVVLGIILCAFVILRHRPNIKRLLSRQEPRVRFFSKKSQ